MKTRSNIASALVLIGIGAWFLAIELSPAVEKFAYNANTWPLPIIGIGAFLALLGLLTWTPGMFVPACIVGGIGAMLYWQNATDNWGTWAYAWTLIPGFVGLGILISGLLSRKRDEIAVGFWMIFGSLVGFGIFGSFLGGSPGSSFSAIIGWLWPVLVILLGLILLVGGLFRRR